MVDVASAVAGVLSGGNVLAEGAGVDIPTVNDFLPPELLFSGTPFAINRIILIRILATVIMMIVLGITAKRAKLVPGHWQSAVEMLLDFVRYNIVYEVMGELRGKQYVPMITTIFMTIFVFNLCGVVPGFNMAATATVVLPLLFSFWTFFQYWIAAAKTKGLGTFLREELIPEGVPKLVLIIVIPMQLIDLFVIRTLSLTVRLFANMMSGHMIVALCLSATQYFLIDAVNKALIPFGALTFTAGFVLTLYEMFVAGLQAFIFATLSAVYINLSFPECE